MKFLIAFAAILAVAAAQYITPVTHHAGGYTAYTGTPAVYGAYHHLYKRGIYTPVTHTAYTTPYVATPTFYGAHHLYKRGLYTPTTYTTGYTTGYTHGGYTGAYTPYAHYY